MRKRQALRHGWFELPGQKGDRGVGQQMSGLKAALELARGKTVLDLGCAEGAIALEFARAGAARILGVEILPDHLDVARQLCAGQPCEFQCVDLNRAEQEIQRQPFDIVLALAVIHKLKDPVAILRFVAGLAGSLFVIRMPAFAEGKPPTRFRSERYGRAWVDVQRELGRIGFVLERTERGPITPERGHEPVLYFRRLGT